MAHVDQTGDWAERIAPTLEEIKSIALEAYAHFPEEIREVASDIVIDVADFPSDNIIDDLGLETPFDILSLFEGTGPAELWTPGNKEGPNRVTLYRRALLDYWCDNEEPLGAIIAQVLLHEIAPHYGFDDEDIDDMEEIME